MIPFSDRIHFSIAFPDVPDSLAALWRCISSFLRDHRALPKTFQVSQIWGHSPEFHAESLLTLDDAEIGSLITERRLDGFMVYAGRSSREVQYFFTQGRNDDSLARLGCVIQSHSKVPDDWTGLIEGVMSRFSTIGAWQWRRRYCYWQSDARLDDRYKRLWGDVPPASRIRIEPASHNLGTETTWVDISKNPGRHKKISSEVFFFPTAEMWLGPHFWQYANCTKKEALAAEFWLVTRETPHFTYFKCWPEAFTRPDGEQGRMQQRLWKLFFHEDCEWPPGSGTICDEPMYGPPELMPGYVPPAE